MSINEEIARDLFGNAVAVEDSSSDDASSDSNGQTDDDSIALTSEAFSQRKRSTLYWKRCSVATTLLKATVNEHRKRLLEGEEARKGLKEWSERVLSRANNEAVAHCGIFDVDQLDLELEASQSLQTRGVNGVGAELMAYWNETVEARVRERLAQARVEWMKEEEDKTEELRQMRDAYERAQQQIAQRDQEIAELEAELTDVADVPQIETDNFASQTEETSQAFEERFQSLLLDIEGLHAELKAEQLEKSALEAKVEELCHSIDQHGSRLSDTLQRCTSAEETLTKLLDTIDCIACALPWRLTLPLSETLGAVTESGLCVKRGIELVKLTSKRVLKSVGCQAEEEKPREQDVEERPDPLQAALLAEDAVGDGVVKLVIKILHQLISNEKEKSNSDDTGSGANLTKLLRIKSSIEELEKNGWTETESKPIPVEPKRPTKKRKAPKPPKRLESKATQTDDIILEDLTEARVEIAESGELTEEQLGTDCGASTDIPEVEYLRIRSVTLHERPNVTHALRIARPFSAPLPHVHARRERDDTLWKWNADRCLQPKLLVATPQKGMKRFIWKRPIRGKTLTLPSWFTSPLAWSHFSGRYFKRGKN